MLLNNQEAEFKFGRFTDIRHEFDKSLYEAQNNDNSESERDKHFDRAKICHKEALEEIEALSECKERFPSGISKLPYDISSDTDHCDAVEAFDQVREEIIRTVSI